MKVLIQMKYNSTIEKKVRQLRREYPKVELYTDTDRSPLEKIQVVLGGSPDMELLSRLQSLKLIIVPFAGVDHLPLDLFRERSIRLSVSHSNGAYVAERALAMVLSLMGRITEYHNDLAQERWHGYWVGGGMEDAWSSLYGKTCGILGTGAIGGKLAGLLRSFDCRIIGYRRTQGVVPASFDEISSSLAEVIENSDILFAALPLTRKTHGILGEKQLQAMKGRILVNVGRGNLVDEKALYKSLTDQTLAGAALDAWYAYPSGKNSCAPSRYPIHHLQNVILSPHVGGFSREALIQSLDEAFVNLETWISRGFVANEIDLNEEY